MRDLNSEDEFASYIDELYLILSSERRRLLLTLLEVREEPLSCSELASAIAAAELETPLDDLEKSEHRTVYTNIYQSHLPRLKAARFVDYETATARIESGPEVEIAITYLSSVDASPTPYDYALTRLAEYAPTILPPQSEANDSRGDGGGR